MAVLNEPIFSKKIPKFQILGTCTQAFLQMFSEHSERSWARKNLTGSFQILEPSSTFPKYPCEGRHGRTACVPHHAKSAKIVVWAWPTVESTARLQIRHFIVLQMCYLGFSVVFLVHNYPPHSNRLPSSQQSFTEHQGTNKPVAPAPPTARVT